MLKRKRYLIALKKRIKYRGPDPLKQEQALVLLMQTIGYRTDAYHRKIIRHQNLTAYGERDSDLTLGFRGGGKSTGGTIVRAIKYAIDDPNVRILFASDTAGASERMLKEVRIILQTCADLIGMFGPFFGGGARDDLGRYRDSYATILQRNDRKISEPTFVALGIGGQLASMHFDVVFLDDIVTRDNSRTKKQRQNVEEWHGSTMLGAQVATTRMHYLGTRYYPNDLYEILERGRSDEQGGVLQDDVLKLPAIETLEDGTEVSTYPERFSIEHLQAKRRKMGRYHFAAQMQQDTSGADGDIFRYSDFRWYGTDDADVPAIPKGLSIYQYADLPAKRTETGDFFALVTVGVSDGATAADRKIYVLDLVHERCGTGKMKANVLHAIERWNPAQVGIEAVQMQAGFAQEMQETLDPRIRGCSVETDKVFRARRVSPFVEQGQVYFPMPETPRGEALAPLLDELPAFPNGDNDDCVDALVGAITLAILSGRAAAFGEDEDAGPEDYDRGSGFRGRY